MSKRKKIIFITLAIVLSIALLVTAFILIFFTIPAKDYDPAKYQLITFCDDENCKCRMYQGKQYFDYEFGTDGTSYQLFVDKTKVDLDVIISWGYGFPFSTIMSYSSYDENQPDYIVGDWTFLTLFAGDLESELFSMEGVNAEFTLPELYENGTSVGLYEKENVRYYPSFRLTMTSHPELYIDARIGVWNSEYYISFNSDVSYYKATEAFLALLKANHIVN